jgi:hypothetical protein
MNVLSGLINSFTSLLFKEPTVENNTIINQNNVNLHTYDKENSTNSNYYKSSFDDAINNDNDDVINNK